MKPEVQNKHLKMYFLSYQSVVTLSRSHIRFISLLKKRKKIMLFFAADHCIHVLFYDIYTGRTVSLDGSEDEKVGIKYKKHWCFHIFFCIYNNRDTWKLLSDTFFGLNFDCAHSLSVYLFFFVICKCSLDNSFQS